MRRDDRAFARPSPHPDKAPKEIVAKQRAAFRPLTEKREATAKKVAARLGVRVDG